MAPFLKHVLAYLLVICLLSFALPLLFGGPFTDPFYLRFTTPKKKSLVIGTSRAAQGIVPAVIIDSLGKKGFHFDLYNYSFTIKSSPFGEPYLRSILRKIDPSVRSLDSQRGLYVIAVDPWSVSTLYYRQEGGVIEFEEKNFPPNNMHWVAMNPNPEYMYRNLDNRLLMIIRKFRHVNHPRLMEDGSLNVTLAQGPAVMEDRLKEYEQFAKENSFSPKRFAGLSATLDSLNRFGTCFLVRIPVHPVMRKIEECWMPDFDMKIQELAANHGIRYLNYITLSDEFETNDGNHLTRKTALRFTGMLSADIASEIKTPTRAGN